MTSIYDSAHQLADAIRTSEEYRQFMEAKEAMLSNEIHRKMLTEFHAKQVELQHAQIMEDEHATEKMEDLERLYSMLSLHPAARTYLEHEFRISRLFSDVHAILGEAMKEVIPIGFEESTEETEINHE